MRSGRGDSKLTYCSGSIISWWGALKTGHSGSWLRMKMIEGRCGWQAEREMLQRSSFEALRRNSMSSDAGMGSDLGRQDSYLSHSGAPFQNILIT